MIRGQGRPKAHPVITDHRGTEKPGNTNRLRPTEALVTSLEIIGASPSQTPYKIKTRKGQYVRCGADILLNAVGHDLEGEAKCTICGRSTHIETNQGKISKLDPPSAVLHVVEIREPGHNAQVVCEASPLFDRQECLQSWLNNYHGPPGRVYGIQEYMTRATDLVSERVGPIRSEPANDPKSNRVRVMCCADCGCSPAECSVSESATDCPSCWLESCCCWVAPTSIA